MKIALYLGLLFFSLFANEANLPAELNGWKSLSFVSSAKNGGELSNAALTINKASYVALLNTPKI